MDKAQKEVDLLAKRLELYYMKLLKKNNFRIFGFSCKNKKTEIDSSEKRGLKDCMFVFKTESTIRKKDIVSKYFILENMKHQYIKNTYFNAYFCIDRKKYENDENYLNKIEKDFKEIIKSKIERNEKTKDIIYNDRFKIKING
ncbi:TPA: hypothetical protein IFJ35_005191 [Escherichia coli]|uniref:hypothetical protein n=1 Tax=Escherichia coli TaxID=562 RepID=UPI0019A8D4C5|nr:hypothetical protein [Escherichia coli]HCL6202556.1 hypothetical protein [Klebsiella pneumoniae]HDQ2627784.1 hypothetical protein [Escherichia coli]